MAGNTFYQQPGAVEFKQCSLPAYLCNIWMSKCMVADLKSFIVEPLNYGYIIYRIDTDHKEDSRYMLSAKYIKYLRCVYIVRTVIKRQYYLLFLLTIFLNNEDRGHAFVLLIS